METLNQMLAILAIQLVKNVMEDLKINVYLVHQADI